MQNLVIVESPTKARKLTDYLGENFTVAASVGHVRDLPKKSLGIDLDDDYQPLYEVSADKKKVVSKLRSLAKTADKIYLAMDPDREGEAIAWHLQYLLSSQADSTKKTTSKKKTSQKTATSKLLRATFHEITKPAVLAAIKQPGQINLDLVDAQQARRVLDRLVGYKISPVLWRKIRRGLSAGRVQSVAVRLIVEREREIQAFKSEEYWEFAVALSPQGLLSADQLKKLSQAGVIFAEGQVISDLPEGVLVAAVNKLDGKRLTISNQQQAQQVTSDLDKASYQVESVKKTERRRQSLPPFTTSLLQQAAANSLGFSAKQTMRLAQQLYEEGFITYHRTDSFNLASSAVAMARQFIEDEYGTQYLPAKPRYFSRKSKNAQEAHEAIRVTNAKLKPDQLLAKATNLSQRHVRLYDLIWRRFLASQMAAAVYDQTSIDITAQYKKHSYQLKANGSINKFAGWRLLFKQSQDQVLPQVEAQQVLDLLEQNPMQKFTQPPARYNDASLVKELEKRGIGRPSTYAAIISVIVARGYVERQDKRFWATPIGMTVNDFLLAHFPDLIDYDFTAAMEEDLDDIANGDKEWVKVIDVFYQPLAKTIDQVLAEAKRVKIPVEKTGEACPECAKLVKAGELAEDEAGEIVIRSGKFGKFKSCSRFPDCKFTENIVETVPDRVCPLCGQGTVVIKNTRWGKSFFACSRYPECDWAAWKKPAADEHLTQKEWQEIKAKRAARKAKRAASIKEKSQAKKTSRGKKTNKKTSKKVSEASKTSKRRSKT